MLKVIVKKTLMITLYLLIGYQAQANFNQTFMDRAPASHGEQRAASSVKNLKNICMLEAGDVGKLKYKGSSYEDAFSKVTDECFQKRTQLFVKMRGTQPDQDRQIQFAESCVNGIKCI